MTAALAPPRRRFTVSEYEQMARAGVLRADDRVELLDGEIVEMTPIGPPHAGIVNRLTRYFVSGVGHGALVAVQNPVRLSQLSEPEPDLVLAKPRSDDYQLSHPVPDDVYLVIEVSDTSLSTDLEVKVPLYAAARIPEVWIVDVEAAAVQVHRRPHDGSYAETSTYRGSDRLAPQAFADLQLEVSALFGS